MAKRITIDPISRIEGHLRVDLEVDNGSVANSWASCTMWRGLENILKGRDPRDAGLMTQRICGVCTLVHYLVSHRAVEDAFGVTIPTNARLVRNLKLGALFVHDHPVHFYALSAFDFVDLLSALQADPAAAVQVAARYTATPYNVSAANYAAVQAKLKTYAQQDPSLGIFGNAYWGSPAYKLSPEQNLVAVSHYLDCLDVQRTAAKMMAILGGKNPHPQADVVGGVTCVEDLADPQRLELFGTYLQQVTAFIDGAYLPDLLMVGEAYAEEALAGVGAGLRSYMSYGGFELDDRPPAQAQQFFRSGLVLDGDLSTVHPFDPARVTEDVTHSWYSGGSVRPPYDGVTDPHYTGLQPAVDGVAYLQTDGKYSWLKSPAYAGQRVEVGPLARIVVNYASGNSAVTGPATALLQRAGLPLSALLSSVGRHAARALETQIIAGAMTGWLNELQQNTQGGDLSTWTNFDFEQVARHTKGTGLLMAPRGSLGHWVRVEDGRIANYQAIAPTTWNASPRDKEEQPGPYEAALVGVHLADPSQPLEILRTIHSFDPCLACAVHLVDARGREVGSYQIGAAGHGG